MRYKKTKTEADLLSDNRASRLIQASDASRDDNPKCVKKR